MASELVSSNSLNLKIDCAFLTVSSSYWQIYPIWQLLNSSLLFSIFKLASPNKATKIFLEDMLLESKTFHILAAKISAAELPKVWHIVRPSFLIVTTVCF